MNLKWITPSWTKILAFWAAYGLLSYLGFEYVVKINKEGLFLLTLLNWLAFYVAEIGFIVTIGFTVFHVFQAFRALSKSPEL